MRLLNVDKLLKSKIWNRGGDARDPYTQGYLDALDNVCIIGIDLTEKFKEG